MSAMRRRRRGSPQPQDPSGVARDLATAPGERAHPAAAAASSPHPQAQERARLRTGRAQRGDLLTGLVGAVVEAWGQVRIARMRVLLSLVGVALAVAAMTFVIAFGGISQQVQKEMMVTWNGRPGTVSAQITPTRLAGTLGGQGSAAGTGSAPAGPGAMGAGGLVDGGVGGSTLTPGQQRVLLDADLADFTQRYGVTRWATSAHANVYLSQGGEPLKVITSVVSGGYGLMHMVQVDQGRWFTAQDEDDLSPAVVISANLLEALGYPVLTEPIALHGVLPAPATYTVVGVLADSGTDDSQVFCDENGCAERETYKMYVLDGPYRALLGERGGAQLPSVEVWAGEGRGQEMSLLMREYFGAKYGREAISLYSNEDDGQDMEEFQRVFTLVVTGAGAAVMLLGALGLINISLVTVRHRIHEIGVRRAFGATSRRVFFSIMMESVVATVLAGVVGIMIAIFATRVVPWERVMDFPLQHTPAFPMSAAIIGLVTAAGVGALAGILPAAVAVRIRPIDAIRF